MQVRTLSASRLFLAVTIVVGLGTFGAFGYVYAQDNGSDPEGASANDNGEQEDPQVADENEQPPAADEIDAELREALMNETAVRDALDRVVTALILADDEGLDEVLAIEEFEQSLEEYAQAYGYEDVGAFRERHYTASGAWGEYFQGVDFEVATPRDAEGEPQWYEVGVRPLGHGWLIVSPEGEDPYTVAFLFVIDADAREWRLAAYFDPSYQQQIAQAYTETEDTDDAEEPEDPEEPVEPEAPEIDAELRDALMTDAQVQAVLEELLAAFDAGDDEALNALFAEDAFRVNVIAEPAADLEVSPARFRNHYFTASELWGEHIRGLGLEVDPDLDEEGEPIWHLETPEGPRGIARLLADDGETEPYHIYFIFLIDPEAEAWRLADYDDDSYNLWWFDPIDPDPDDPEEPEVPEEPVEPEIVPLEVEITDEQRRGNAIVLMPTIPAEFAGAMTAEQQRAYADAIFRDVEAFEEFENVELIEVAVDDIGVFLRSVSAAAAEAEPLEYNGTLLEEEDILKVLAAGYAFTVDLEDVLVSLGEEPYEVEVEVIEVVLELDEPLEFPEGYEELPAELLAKLSYEAVPVEDHNGNGNGNDEAAANGNDEGANGNDEANGEAHDADGNGENGDADGNGDANGNGEDGDDNGVSYVYRFRYASAEPMVKEELDALIELAPHDDEWQLAIFDLSEMSEEAEPVTRSETRMGTFVEVSFDASVTLHRVDEHNNELHATRVEDGQWSFPSTGRQEAEDYLLLAGTPSYEDYLAEHGSEATAEEQTRREEQALRQAVADAAQLLPEDLLRVLRLLAEFQPEPEPTPEPTVREGVRDIADEGDTIIAAVRDIPSLDATVGLVDSAGVEGAVGRVRNVGAGVSTRDAGEGLTWIEIQRFSGEAQRDWGVEPYGILGFQFDVGIGVDFTLGHDRSEVFPMIPDPNRKQITDANGSGFFSLHLGYNFGGLIGEPVLSEFYVGFDAQLGFGGFYRYSKLGGRLAKKFYIPVGGMTLALDFGLSIGALQHKAGGQDITDVTFFMLTERKGVPAAQAREETVGQDIESPWMFYAAFKPRVSLWLIPQFEVYFSMGLLFATTTTEFRLGDRRFNTDDPDLQVPGFEWNGIGFQLTLGGTLHF